MSDYIDPDFKPVNEQVGRLMDSSWKRVLDIAQNHIVFLETRTSTDSASTTRTDRTDRTDSYERERQMVQALDNVFALVSEGEGFHAFIATITCTLEYDNPVCMAFLNHVIEKSCLQDRDTIVSVSPIIMDKINKKPSRIQRILSVISKRKRLERSASKRFAIKSEIVSAGPSDETATFQTSEQVTIKRNAVTLWSILAERYAGQMCLCLWKTPVCDFLFKALADPLEDLGVRVYSLVALEKFALTGTVKNIILNHGANIRKILFDVILECERANKRIFLLSNVPESEASSDNIHRIFEKSTQLTESGQISPFTSLDCFETGFIPNDAFLRDEWTKYVQLGLTARWALDHTFRNDKEALCPWDVSKNNVIMNPFDATTHMKVGMNGLGLRNDRPHFESVRATACVRRGVWFYEALVLTNGIMQIGWANSNCAFRPEDGYGVGDDNNGFAFDTYRSSVWADGHAIYPRGEHKEECQPGDVVGCLLDLERGACSYFINGQECITITFEHPKDQKIRLARMGLLQTGTQPTQIAPREPHVYAPHAESPHAQAPRPPHGYYHQATNPKPLGLYPTVSLTTHQQVHLNFGDRPWLFPPPVHADGIRDAGFLDEAFEASVLRWAKKRPGPTVKSRRPLRPEHGADELSNPPTPVIDSEDEDDDDDCENGSLCQICFAEPANTVILPCKHDQIGSTCAGILTKCPLCRTNIEGRMAA